MHQRPRCVEQWSYNVSYIHQGMLPCAWIHTVDSDLLCGVLAQCIQDIIRSWFLHLKLKQTPLFGWQRFHNTKFEIHFALMVRKNWNEVMSITSNIKWWQCFTAFYIFSISMLCLCSLSIMWVNTKSISSACFYIRWLLISLSAHIEYIRHFDLLKAFGYIERVVKSEKTPEKNYVTSYVRIMSWATISSRYHEFHRH